jgi:hypothetical protein
MSSLAMSDNKVDIVFEVLTPVVIKNSNFWDITPCSPSKVDRRFEGTCLLQLQSRIISRARNQRENSWQAEVSFFLDLFDNPEDRYYLHKLLKYD